MKNSKLVMLVALLAVAEQMSASSSTGFVEQRAQIFGQTLKQQRQQNQAAQTIQKGWRHHKQAQGLRHYADFLLEQRAQAQVKTPVTPHEAFNEILEQGGSVAAHNVTRHIKAKTRGLKPVQLTSDEHTYAAMLEGALSNAGLSQSEKLDILGSMIESIKN